MKVNINNEYEFMFLEHLSLSDFHVHMLKKIESYQLLIIKLEDYESTYTDFNMVEIVKVIHQESSNVFHILMKVNNLLAYNQDPFYYKNLTIRF